MIEFTSISKKLFRSVKVDPYMFNSIKTSGCIPFATGALQHRQKCQYRYSVQHVTKVIILLYTEVISKMINYNQSVTA